MAKLPSPFPEIIITQGLHGQYQSFKALDLSHKYRDFIATIDDMEVVLNKSKGTDGEYFHIELPDADKTIIQCVHATPTRMGKFKKGEKIGTLIDYGRGKDPDDHWHIAINHKGIWFPFPSIIDKNTPIILRNGVSLTLSNWSSYQDIQLNLPQSNNNKELTEKETEELVELINNSNGIAVKEPLIENIQNQNYFEAFDQLIRGNNAKADEIYKLNNTIPELNQNLIKRRKEIEKLNKEIEKLKEKKK